MLFIVTHVNVNREVDRSRCFRSVEKAMVGLDVEWNIIRLDCKSHEEFLTERHKSIENRQGFVVFVDDDDWLEPIAIYDLLRAIEKNHNVGIVYTDENHAFINDGIIANKILSKAGSCYEDLFYSASRIHHLCAINSAYITQESLILALSSGCGIEWAMKAEAALQHGAMYIPKPHYNYLIHNDRVTSKVNVNFNRCKEIFLPKFTEWQKYFGKIPVL